VELINAILLIQRKFRILMIITLTALVTSGILNLFFLDKIYASSLTLIISNQKNPFETKNLGIDDIIVGEKLVDTYSIIAKSDSVLEKIILELDLNISVKKLGEQIIINNQSEKRLMEITIEDTDPQGALEKANVFLNAFIEEIKNILNINNVQIISYPKLPIHPIRPNAMLNLLISIFTGLVIGIIIIYLLTYIDNTLENIGELEHRFNLPILAKVSYRNRENNLPYIEFVINYFNGELDKYTGTILMLSSLSSKVASDFLNPLSNLIAYLGKTVLVLDYNFDNPYLNEDINIENNIGWIDLLKKFQHQNTDDEEWSKYWKNIRGQYYKNFVRRTNIPNLDIISMGIIGEDDYKLLISNKVKPLLDSLIKDYDIVMINGGSTIHQMEFFILAQWTDEIILIETLGESSLEGIEKMIEKLGSNRNKIKGFVINQVHSMKITYKAIMN